MNFSIDACVWLLIVVFLAVSTLSFLQLQNTESEFDAQREVFFISEMLVSTPGIPENWNSAAVEQVGLLEKYHGYYKKCYLDREKIENLMQMDYAKLLSLLKVENIKIKFQDLEIGVSKQKAKITRYCNCDGEPCELEIET